MPEKKLPRKLTIDDLLTKNGLTLARLKRLNELAGHDSLNEAAIQHGVGADTYTNAIHALEETFKIELLDRPHQPLRFTDDGLSLVKATNDFVSVWLEFINRDKSHGFNIGAGESLLKWIVIPRISSFPKARDNASEAQAGRYAFRLSNLQNRHIIKGVRDRSLDFGLVRKESLKGLIRNENPDATKEERQRPLGSAILGSVHYVLCLPLSLISEFEYDSEKRKDAFEELTTGRENELDFDNLKFVLENFPLAMHLDTAYIQSELESKLEGRGIRPRICLRSDTFPNAMTALQTGEYATLMIEFPGFSTIPNDVVKISLKHFLEHTFREIHLVWSHRNLSIRKDGIENKNKLVEKLKWKTDP